MLQWIHGSDASAACMEGSDHWIVFPANERPAAFQQPDDPRGDKPTLFLGVIFQLHHLRKETHRVSGHGRALTSLRQRSNGRIFFSLFGLLILLALAVFTFAISGHGRSESMLIMVMSDILIIPIMFWLSRNLLFITEWLCVRGTVQKGAPLFSGSLLTWRINRVVWELGPMTKQAVALLLIAACTVAATGWGAFHANPYAIGAFLGAWFYLIVAISPFSAGPATHLFKRILGIEQILQLQDQFLLGFVINPSSALKGRFSFGSFAAAASLVAWILITASSFDWIRDALYGYNHVQILVVQFLLDVLGFTFCLWMIMQVINFLRQHSLLRMAGSSETFNPTAFELDAWRKSCALLRHIPELANLPWQWRWVPAGTLLVRKGDTDRNFHWLASGEATVIGLSSTGENVQFATMHAGSGFGEIAFLEAKPRSADVFMRKPSIVATLNHDAVQSLQIADFEARMGDLARASQVMDMSPMFKSMPSQAKEEWLRNTKLCRAKNTDSIIDAGSTDTWMGMVVSGGIIIVERNGKVVATLDKGGVFGEMAYWTKSPRAASISAKGDLLYLRWESEFWAAQAKSSGLDKYLDQLVSDRSKRNHK